MNERTQRAKSRFDRFAAFQHRRAGAITLTSFLIAALAVPVIVGVPPLSDGLTLNSDLRAMLPSTAPSVRDLREIEARFAGTSALILTVESHDVEALHAFVRELAPRIEGMDEHQVATVDWNIEAYVAFVEDHRHLHADLEDLRAIRDVLRERIDYERARANPFFVDLEEEPPPDPSATLERIRAEARAAEAEITRRFPEGFLQHPSRDLVMIVVHTTIHGGDLQPTRALVDAIRQTVASLAPSYAPDLEVRYGGTLIEIRDETESLIEAVGYSTLLTVVLVMIAIYLLFLRIRPIPLLSLALLPPVVVTFAIAELTVDYLNASSAFLAAIVVGNGINPSVVWLARYFEERRNGATSQDALRTTHAETWKGTLTASLASAVAYGSLMSTDYRGFRDFGVIGATGMVACWAAAYLVLPALTVMSERWRPLTFSRSRSHRGFYGALFARLASELSRAVLGWSFVVTVVAGGLTAWAVIHDPLEYDYRNLRSVRDPNSDAEYVLAAARVILSDTTSGSGLAVLASSRDDARAYLDYLEDYRRGHPTDFGRVTSIEDWIPRDQEEKIALIAEIRGLMLEVRPHVDAEVQATLDEQLPPESIAPLLPEDVPEGVARPFAERDGTRGRLLIVEHHPDESDWDGRYQARWARAARNLRSPGSGERPPLSGTALVMSDVMERIWDDGPRAIAIALFATILLIALSFRSAKERWLTLGSLLLGVLFMTGTMAALGMHLNFLNFIAFPITFGIGAEYAVNVMRRYAEEAPRAERVVDAVRAAVEGTGGAVILCSLTTVIGYISLFTSANRALNSFGLAMAISEVTCLIAAVLVLPAALQFLGTRSQK